MAERGALKALDPNAKKGVNRTSIGGPPSKIPRAGGKLGDGKSELEAKLHEVLADYDELASQYAELEATNKKLQNSNINMEEEAAEWKKSYESLQAEGTELFQTYERKCAMLKEVSKQLDDLKSKVAERDARLKSAQSEKDEAEKELCTLRENAKTHSEALSRHESRYLTLKEEHNQTMVKLEELQQQLRDAQRSVNLSGTDAVAVDTVELDQVTKRLNEALASEASARAELAKVKARLGSLEAANKTQGALSCTSPLPTDSVGALPSFTPLRTGATPGKGMVPKTPSGAMMEMESMSPESLRQRAESLLISNDLLRQELNAAKRELDAHNETVAALESEVRDYKAQVNDAKKAARCATEKQVAAEEARDAAHADARDALDAAQADISTLKARVQEFEQKEGEADVAMTQELSSVKTQLDAAETRKLKAEKELANASKQIEALAAAAKNAENDMRLMYKRHKKEMSDLQERFKSGELEERYRVASHKAKQMEALVHKWVGYAREMNEVRALQEKRAAAIQANAKAVEALMQDALGLKKEADEKVSKWRRQCQRMQQDMTKLVHIKTRALEERKELHEKYLELCEEVQAQDEYARKLEENEQALKASFASQSAEELAATRKDAEDRMRLEMQDKVHAADSAYEELLNETMTLRSQVAEMESAAASAQAGVEEVSRLTAQVAQLGQAAQQHDQIFDATMFDLQAKEEKCGELEGKVEALVTETKQLKAGLAEAQRSAESERGASQEALDELTQDLSCAHEQLAKVEAQVEDAEARAAAAMQAAACGLARLTHVTVGLAADEDNSTEMIDPELRLHWCDGEYEKKLAETKTPYELRALLVGIASTVEHLLTTGAARRDAITAEVTALTAQVQELTSASAENSATRKELDDATNDLLVAVERGEALQAKLVAAEAQVVSLEEEATRLNALLEDTSRENVELSVCKDELLKIRPEREALQSSLDACMNKLSQACSAEEQLRRKADLAMEKLKKSLQVSQSDCQNLDAILAHVRASLQMYVDTPMPADKLKELLHRISPDDKMDEDAE